MKTILYAVCILSAVFFFSCAMTTEKKTNAVAIQKNNTEEGIVLLELFTSQGCSSCPPADVLLGKYALQNNPRIIPIAFHVDYWNRLGWTDPFSNALFSQRQNEYAQKFNSESVYTPQLVLNGQREMVGSNDEKITAAIDDLLKEKDEAVLSITNLKTEGISIEAGYSLAMQRNNQFLQAVLVQKKAVTKIKSGENKGHSLIEYNVVRDFVSASVKDKTGTVKLQLPPDSKATDFFVVIFLQDKSSYKVSGAVQQSLN